MSFIYSTSTSVIVYKSHKYLIPYVYCEKFTNLEKTKNYIKDTTQWYTIPHTQTHTHVLRSLISAPSFIFPRRFRALTPFPHYYYYYSYYYFSYYSVLLLLLLLSTTTTTTTTTTIITTTATTTTTVIIITTTTTTTDITIWLLLLLLLILLFDYYY